MSSEAQPTTTGVTLPYRTSDGAVIHIKGWRQGPPLVFSHAWSAGHKTCEYQMSALTARGFRCIGGLDAQAVLETFGSSGPDTEQRLAMLTMSVQKDDIADVRPAFGKEPL
jgi:hypothetical protein